MAKVIKRDVYLQKLKDRMWNGEVKIITGSRRCGKSWLLKKIFKEYLISQKVPEKNIIIVSLDIEDEETSADLTDKETLKKYLYDHIKSQKEQYYVFLDEIQEVDGFEKLVNGLAAKSRFLIYGKNITPMEECRDYYA